MLAAENHLTGPEMRSLSIAAFTSDQAEGGVVIGENGADNASHHTSNLDWEWSHDKTFVELQPACEYRPKLQDLCPNCPDRAGCLGVVRGIPVTAGGKPRIASRAGAG